MADNAKIEWTDATWNPITGCTKVSAGCKHCYAEREWPRMTKLVPAYAGRDFTDVRTHADRLDQPLRWKKPRLIFVNSMSDLFHPDVPDSFLDKIFAVMVLADHHVFQVLTKRADRMRAYLTDPARKQRIYAALLAMCGGDADEQHLRKVAFQDAYPNVWLGVTVEDRAAAEERVPLLLATPASIRWLSCEPLLGAVSLTGLPGGPDADEDVRIDGLRGTFVTSPRQETPSPLSARINWVVAGGESGPKARPMHPDWARSLRDQCAAADVPFLYKQWGEWAPSAANSGEGDGLMARVGKKAAGRLLDGVQHDGWPVAKTA